MSKFEMLDKALECFNSSELLEEVVRALDEDTALNVLAYIARMHDIIID